MRAGAATICIASAMAACSFVTSLDGLDDGTVASTTDAGGLDGDVLSDGASDGGADTNPNLDADADADTSALLGCDAAGLLAYWPMNEGTGATTEECKARHPASFVGAVTWTTRGGRPAVAFAGKGHLALGQRPALHQPGPKTIAGWIKSNAAFGGYASVVWSYGGKYGYELILDGAGKLYANVGLGPEGNAFADLWASTVVTDWRHVALVYRPGDSLEGYVDGMRVARVTVLEGTTTPIPNAGPAPHDGPFRLGPVFDTEWNGALDDVRIFGRALSAAEVAVLAKE